MKLKSLAMWAACLLVITAGAAMAQNPHFIYVNASLQGVDVKVSFKEAGLGDTATTYVAAADATAVYLCINGGDKHPQAANKETINQTVSAQATFDPKNGTVSQSILIEPPGPGSFSCPSGQRLVFDSVSYTNIRITDITHGEGPEYATPSSLP